MNISLLQLNLQYSGVNSLFHFLSFEAMFIYTLPTVYQLSIHYQAQRQSLVWTLREILQLYLRILLSHTRLLPESKRLFYKSVSLLKGAPPFFIPSSVLGAPGGDKYIQDKGSAP